MSAIDRVSRAGASSLSQQPFYMLIQSQSLDALKSIHILPHEDGNISVRVSLKIRDDYRWHWLSDTLKSTDEAHLIVDSLIDTHIRNHAHDAAEMEEWKSKLSDLRLYKTSGVSVFRGTV